MNRRTMLLSTIATASGILLPLEPRRVYSFAPAGGWPVWALQSAVFIVRRATGEEVLTFPVTDGVLASGHYRIDMQWRDVDMRVSA